MDRHLFLDGPLHSLQTNAELVFEQLTDRAYTSIPKVIDIVRLVLRRVLTHLQDVPNHLEEIIRRQQRVIDAFKFRLAHLDVELESTDTREVKLARIEEHRLKQTVSGLHCW